MALDRLQRQIQEKIYADYVGREVLVLAEGESAKSKEDLTGHSTCHKVVNFRGNAHLSGQIVKVRITAAKANSLYGAMVGNATAKS
jgi:tRNA-2-methylthio-N6-dimethylallyladenosine synthase